MQRFEGLTGDESDDDAEEAAEAENTPVNEHVCDDGQLWFCLISLQSGTCLEM